MVSVLPVVLARVTASGSCLHGAGGWAPWFLRPYVSVREMEGFRGEPPFWKREAAFKALETCLLAISGTLWRTREK